MQTSKEDALQFIEFGMFNVKLLSYGRELPFVISEVCRHSWTEVIEFVKVA